jgi:HK97 family phage portal protein
MRLLDKIFGTPARNDAWGGSGTIDDFAELLNMFAYGGIGYGSGLTDGGITQTMGGQLTELSPRTFVGLASDAYASCGPVFACMLVRMLVFSSIRFEWQRMRQGKPSDTFANDPNLRILQRPWANGTTQDLLTRMIQDADLAGNAYITYDPTTNELVRLRPDWVNVVLEPRNIRGGPDELAGGQIGWKNVGYVYTERGFGASSEPVFLHNDEVVHYMPLPDPLAHFRGMSWLTPVLREIRADHAMMRHEQKFFDNAATPNMIVKYQPGMTMDKIKAFKEILDEGNTGVENAYKTLHLAPGADPVPVGTNMRQMDFSNIQGGGETRIAAAAGVPPVIAGMMKGIESSTYSNYSQARRRFADGTMHPLWENVAGSLESILPRPGVKGGDDVRLWYDAKDIPFLREDEKDSADIQNVEAATINALIVAGYEADSVIAAVIASDWRLLKHSGLMSVQLLPPGAMKPGARPIQNTASASDDHRPRTEIQAEALANLIQTNGAATALGWNNGGSNDDQTQ